MTGRSWRLGRILGTEMYLDPSWLVVLVLVAVTVATGYGPKDYPGWGSPAHWGLGIVTAVLGFLSVLWHEFFHVLAAKAAGRARSRKTLFPFGAAAVLPDDGDRLQTELALSLAGPLASLVLGLAIYLVYPALASGSPYLPAVARYAGLLNLALGALTLVPAFPLDGGRILRSLIRHFTGNARLATRAASWSGQTVAFVLVLLGLVVLLRGDGLTGLWLTSVGWLLRNAAVSSHRESVVREVMAGVTAAELMSHDLVSVPPGLTLQELVDQHATVSPEPAYAVVDQGVLVGVVWWPDLQAVERSDWPSTTVGSVMTPYRQLKTVLPDDDGNTILTRLADESVHQLPVVRDGHLEGMVSRNDVVRFLQWQTELGMYG